MPLFLRLLRIGYPREKFLKRDIVKFAEFGDRLQRGESYFVFIAGNTQTRIVQNILFRMIVLFPDLWVSNHLYFRKNDSHLTEVGYGALAVNFV